MSHRAGRGNVVSSVLSALSRRHLSRFPLVKGLPAGSGMNDCRLSELWYSQPQNSILLAAITRC